MKIYKIKNNYKKYKIDIKYKYKKHTEVEGGVHILVVGPFDKLFPEDNLLFCLLF